MINHFSISSIFSNLRDLFGPFNVGDEVGCCHGVGHDDLEFHDVFHLCMGCLYRHHGREQVT